MTKSEPLIRPDQSALLRAAASVLRELFDDGYIDWPPGLNHMADDLDDITMTYAGCAKVSPLRAVDAAIPTAGAALTIWREKLAGVTPGPWWWSGGEVFGREINGVNDLVACGLRYGASDPDDAAHIVRSDRLSRILADETTVEGLFSIIREALSSPAALVGGGSLIWTPEAVERMEEQGRYVARACLNHLAQLALGESQ